MTPSPPLIWTKSSHSNPDGGNSPDWNPTSGTAAGAVPVRGSMDPTGPVLGLPVSVFGAFISCVKSGTFPG
ncbi:DUF397 domain-containing protein [Streptomyces sp. NPDC059788]|uniref:DUF397 domain-containing protein n=1 Tax=Streptomyces sp. NPDC059788 TaxID=3346948 RepID=UPI0036699F59